MGNVQFWDHKILIRAAFDGKIAMTHRCCCVPDCEGCIQDAPLDFLVTISGVAEWPPETEPENPCREHMGENCGNYNAAWTLDARNFPEDPPATVDPCRWAYDHDGDGWCIEAGGDTLVLQIDQSGDDVIVSVGLCENDWSNPADCAVCFEEVYEDTSAIDCKSLNVDIPLKHAGDENSLACDWSAAQCHITAL